MMISNTVWVSQLKIWPCEEKRHDSVHTVRSLWLLSYSAVSRWMTCMCFSVWHSMTQRRENQPQKCYWTKKQMERKENEKINTSRNRQRYSVYYSVVETCCQKLHIAMVISKNKMWNTVSSRLLGLSWLYFFVLFFWDWVRRMIL